MNNSSLACPDSNLVVHWVMEPSSSSVDSLWQGWFQQQTQLHAPLLLRYECTNVIHRYVGQGLASQQRADVALDAVLALPIVLHADDNLHRLAIAIAARFRQVAAYDSHFLALAQRLGTEFWTTDQRLYRAVGGALPWVRLVTV